MKLIVGLGNPGEEYEKTRHNVGFLAVDHLFQKLGADAKWKHDKKYNAEIARTTFLCEDIILAKPQTFMNDSGRAVQSLLHYYFGSRPAKAGHTNEERRLKPATTETSQLLVIHDELDLELGTLRLTFGSGPAGHNGIKSIIEMLGTKDFWRLRIGIGPKRGDGKAFVLKPFTKTEQPTLEQALKLATHTVQMMFELGPQRAQTEINRT